MTQKRRPPKQTNGKPQESDFFELLRAGTRALHQGQIAEATRLLEQAHRLEPENGDAALNLAGAYILSKKFKQAVALLEPLSKREPGNPMVWTNLGAAYLGNPILAKDEHHEKAIAAFKQALEIDPKAPNVAYNLGLIYRDRQETAEAIRWFKRALQANPNDRDALRFIEQLSE